MLLGSSSWPGLIASAREDPCYYLKDVSVIPGQPENVATRQRRIPHEEAVAQPDSASPAEESEAVRERAIRPPGDDGMRRIVVLLVLTTVALLLSSGMALAVTRHCKPGVVCYGTKYRDTLYGTASGDVIYGKGRGDITGWGSQETSRSKRNWWKGGRIHV